MGSNFCKGRFVRKIDPVAWRGEKQGGLGPVIGCGAKFAKINRLCRRRYRPFLLTAKPGLNTLGRRTRLALGTYLRMRHYEDSDEL